MRYTTVFFDGYGTLFDKTFDALYETCQIIVDDLQLHATKEAFLHHWDRYFFPLLHADDFVPFWDAHILSLQEVFADLRVQARAENYVSDLFDAFGRVPAFCDVNPTLAALSQVQTGVISNADHGHLTAALHANCLHFEVVVSSESARCYKPHPKIFATALTTCAADPAQTLYVGDSQDDDIIGAKRAGIPIAWLNRTGTTRNAHIPVPDYEINSLSELVDIVEGKQPRACPCVM